MFEIRILHTDELISEENFKHVLSLMPDQRKFKVSAYHFPKDQRLSLGAGLLLHRWLLEKGISYQDAKMQSYANGKPSFVQYPHLHFNLSHSGEYVVLATGEYPIGVDIEEIKTDYLDIAERFFTSEEIQQIHACDSISEKEDLFFRLWTMKESYMKVTGLGFELPLHSFSIQIDPQKSTFLYPEGANEFSLYELDAPKGYKLSVCCQQQDNQKQEC